MWKRKLSDSAVRQIRERRAAGERAADLAEEFGVGRPLIWRICRGAHRVKAGGPIRVRKAKAAVPTERQRARDFAEGFATGLALSGKSGAQLN